MKRVIDLDEYVRKSLPHMIDEYGLKPKQYMFRLESTRKFETDSVEFTLILNDIEDTI